VVVGMCWQVTLVALPIYIVIQKWSSAIAAVIIVAVTSVILKLTWYNHLRKQEAEMGASTKLPATTGA
jgi:SSS family solute:Na+ symporter